MPSASKTAKRTPTRDKAFSKAFGARMAKRRRELGLTQLQVAEALSMAQQTYGHYEVGRYADTNLRCSLGPSLWAQNVPLEKNPAKLGRPRIFFQQRAEAPTENPLLHGAHAPEFTLIWGNWPGQEKTRPADSIVPIRVEEI